MALPPFQNCTIAVIGLGYVGLPLALAFAERKKCFKTKLALDRKIIGFDINAIRINQLNEGLDNTNELKKEQLENLSLISFTCQLEKIILADVFIITVPTPIKDGNIPDLLPLMDASTTVGKALKIRENKYKKNLRKKHNPIIIYESTVYPGCTEEICLPILEKESNLEANKDFFYGYSPERINPGDKNHKLKDVQKVTSGGNKESGSWINNFYSSIIEAGTHLTKNIKIAETAKVIENTQRDLNIALVNELAFIFNKMNIDTLDVLNAASSKWNFLNFRPGLVGGHCIGIDPYYLTWKAEQIGYKPQIVLSGREVNEKMTDYILGKIVDRLNKLEINLEETRILICGISFKEDCPDIRNSKVIDFINLSKDLGFRLNIYDPIADLIDLDLSIKKYVLKDFPNTELYDVIFIAVPHREIREIPYEKYNGILNLKGFIFDLKGILVKRNNIIHP